MSEAKNTWANIAAVERETGIGKDTLRVWERRYGFPRPERDENGDRLYPGDQVSRLRLIKRLMDRGHRPGRLVASEDAELHALAVDSSVVLPGGESGSAVPRGRMHAGHDDGSSDVLAPSADMSNSAYDAVFSALRQHDVVGLRRSLTQSLAAEGLQTFVLDVLPR